MKKFISIILSFLLVFSLFGCSKAAGVHKFSKTFIDLFDTASTVTAYDKSQAEFDENYNKVHSELKRYFELYDIYNGYDGVTNLKYINEHAAEKPIEADGEIIELLLFGKKAYELTNGKVNICMGSVLSVWHEYRQAALESEENAAVPSRIELENAAEHADIDSLVIDEKNSTVYFSDSQMKLDVGAIAKGFVCDKIYDFITKNNLWQSAVVSLGGNVTAIGEKPNGEGYTVGIENPSGGDYVKKVTAHDKTSVVTSGGYQRYYTVGEKKYCHIINPDTLYPSELMQSVTVISDNSALADAMSTALFCMSVRDGLKLVEKTDGIEAVWLDNDSKVIASSGAEVN